MARNDGADPTASHGCWKKYCNANSIQTSGFSNKASASLYQSHWPADPEARELYKRGRQCGGCSSYAPFNEDWGLCCQQRSRHFLETIFEHFTCTDQIEEGWSPHSFSADSDL